MNMGIRCQLSAVSKIVVGRASLAVREPLCYNLFKHKNAPAMLPEHLALPDG
jgi:hypothetical protein